MPRRESGCRIFCAFSTPGHFLMRFLYLRHTTQGMDPLNLGMGFKRLGGNLGSGSSSSGYQIALRIFPLIIGVAGLTTTLLAGSFLWGYVSRRNKKECEQSSPLKDLFPPARYKPNTVLTMHEFIKPARAPSPVSILSDYDNNAYCDTLVFDPEQDYAQVLAEARLHAAATQILPVTNPPLTKGCKRSLMTRSSSARQHDAFLEDLEAMFPQHQDTRFQDLFKSSKSWKKLLFWKRSKKSNVLDIDMNGGIHSSCTTPLHQAFKFPKTRATVTPTTPTSAANKKPISKRSSSGPVYSDGIPYVPNRNGRPVSGPLSGSATPSRDGLYESAYVPLKKPGGGGAKTSSGPLYVS